MQNVISIYSAATAKLNQYSTFRLTTFRLVILNEGSYVSREKTEESLVFVNNTGITDRLFTNATYTTSVKFKCDNIGGIN